VCVADSAEFLVVFLWNNEWRVWWIWATILWALGESFKEVFLCYFAWWR